VAYYLLLSIKYNFKLKFWQENPIRKCIRESEMIKNPTKDFKIRQLSLSDAKSRMTLKKRPKKVEGYGIPVGAAFLYDLLKKKDIDKE
jgi:hypothetical protein